MDFHTLAAAHLPPVHRKKLSQSEEDRYYRNCPDVPLVPPRALTPVAAVAVLVLLATLASV